MGHAGQPIEDIARQTYQDIDNKQEASDTAADGADATAGAVDGGMDTVGGDEDGTAISRNGCTVVPATTHASSSSSSSDTASSSSHSLTPLSILRSTWRWGHLCPTAPDTLPCYPYTEKEPFILFHDNNTNASGSTSASASASANASASASSGGGGAKRVLFAGNQRVFDSSLEVSADGRHNTLFMCVPR